MAQGASTLLDFMLLPKPCSTRNAGRCSRGATPEGTRTVPTSVRPFDLNEMRSSAIPYAPLFEHLPGVATIIGEFGSTPQGLRAAAPASPNARVCFASLALTKGDLNGLGRGPPRPCPANSQ